MSSNTKTTTTNSYDPTSLNTYHGLQGGIGSTLSYFMTPGRLQNAWMQQSNNAIGQIGNRMNSNTNSNLIAGGWGGGNQGAFQQAQLNRNMRATSNMQGNAFLNSLIQGSQLQLQATGMAQGYQPLQTGSTQDQTKSGLGTWLPQLAGAGLGLGSSFLSGGIGAAPSMGALNNIGGLAGSSFGAAGNLGNQIFNGNPSAYAPPGNSFMQPIGPTLPGWGA